MVAHKKMFFKMFNYFSLCGDPTYVEIFTLLPPANEVCEGYVFTGVCLSTGGGVACVVGGVSGRGACVAGEGACMHGRGACKHGRGACVAGGCAWQGHAWQGACIAGGCAWQGAYMAGGMHGGGGMCGGGGMHGMGRA